jgi:Domain of unknown function (DUF1707)/Cell wall-active antibiotics response 4TMS YvqF
VSNVPEERPDARARLRVSHEDRERVAEILRDAAGDGRLDLEELEQRLERAFAAKTYGDLEPLVADLPMGVPARPTASPAPAAPVAHRSQAILSEHKRKGAWVVPGSYTATAIMGSVLLDLRQAAFTEPEVTISCTSIMGEIKIRVGADVVVIADVTPVLGEFDVKSSKGLAPMPTQGRVVRVRGTAFMGTVSVERLAPNDTRLQRWRD